MDRCRAASSPLRAGAALAALLAGCHVVRDVDVTRRGPIVVGAPDLTGPREPGAPTATLGPLGELRLVRPSFCAAPRTQLAEDLVRVEHHPNLATFIVGLVATAGGLVATAVGVSSDEPGGHPLTYLGPSLGAVGVGLAIGPWTRREPHLRRVGQRTEQLGTARVACGDVPLPASPAVIAVDGHRGVGALDATGTFSLPVFTWLDLLGELPGAVRLDAWLDGRGEGAPTLSVALEAGALLVAQDQARAAAGLTGPAPAMGKFPDVVVEPPTVRYADASRARVRVGLAAANDGVGPAARVRLQLRSPHPELDGRWVYVGDLAVGQRWTGALEIDLSLVGAGRLLGATLELSALALDAHDTTTSRPSVFRGMVGAATP